MRPVCRTDAGTCHCLRVSTRPTNPIPDGGVKQEEPETDQYDLKAAQVNFDDLLEDIVDYTQENRIRRLYYRDCLRGEIVSGEQNQDHS
jgi:hypothetical protein